MHIVLDGRPIQDHFPGIGRYVYELARVLPALAPQYRFTLLYQPTAPNHLFPLNALPADLIRQPVDASPFNLWQHWRVPAVLRQLRPDIYHATYYMMPFRPGVPTLLTVYDDIPGRFPHYFPTWKHFFIEESKQIALRIAGHIVAISEQTRQDISRRYRIAAQRFTVIPLAADERFRPQPAAALITSRKKYALPDAYFLYIGSNKPHKNLLTLVQGLHRAKETDPDVPPLVIAGPWDDRYNAVKQYIRGKRLQNNVIFLGMVPDDNLPALYAGATAFLFLSRYEGFGLPVLEAMACGTPVICARSASLPEVGGEAVLYVSPDSPQQLAREMGRVGRDEALQQTLSERGLARAALFSWTESAKQTITIYRSLYRQHH